MKTFGTTKPYEEFGCDEIESLLLIHNKIKEVERLCMEMNSNA
jgi:hypothetical protein